MKLQNNVPEIRSRRTDGKTGLELESHRIDYNGCLSHRAHPFDRFPHIDRDFSEEQIEINTPPEDSPEKALNFMRSQLKIVHQDLKAHDELLWPFSNPAYIRNERDIPVAVYTGEKAASHEYRLYLADRYGKYKMSYSGIHFNYSFSEDLLLLNHRLDQDAGRTALDFRQYKDQFYLKLAEKMLAYSWAVVALLAASPLVDDSFFVEGKSGKGIFTGYSSMRCGEAGYWNPFTPVLSYDSVPAYVDSIEEYIRRSLLIEARELYYPVRIKPAGSYTMEALKESGINHIELRMVDLNPFCDAGMDCRDLEFLKLLLVWLASIDDIPLNAEGQMLALQNYKAAALYDWRIGRILMPGEESQTVEAALFRLVQDMTAFYHDDPEALKTLAYQKNKVDHPKARYAHQVLAAFGEDYLRLGLSRSRKIQEAYNV